MIPHRVRLEGFLSYKEPQEIPFGGSPLWMLAGLNGSGKSSVFDAVTYALFGHHRGGSQNAVELINKESNQLAVDFDFKLDGTLYRIRRTYKRTKTGTGSGTQQIFRHAGSGVGSEDGWEAVPDTIKKVDFEKWVQEKIGLTYETFTSSVLLLQGKAEKLLDSKPSGRAEVLAGIVDLDRYQRLHEKANAKKLAYKAQLEALAHQQAAVPEVTPAEYAAAEDAIDAAEAARAKAQEAVDALLEVEAGARRWADAVNRRDAARAKLAAAEALLGDAAKIEAEYARFRELTDALPAAHTVVTTRGKEGESRTKTERYQQEQERVTAARREAEAKLDQSRKKKAQLQKTLADHEARQATVGKRLRELSAVLQSLRLAEDQEAELARLADDLKRFPADPAAAVREAQAEAERLTELAHVLPRLDSLHSERSELLQAQHRQKDAAARMDGLLADGNTAKAKYQALTTELAAAAQARTAADEDAAAAGALLTAARDRLAAFAKVSSDPTCSACGQPLTPAHREREKASRAAEVKAAEVRQANAVATRQAAADAHDRLTAAEKEQKAKLDALRDDFREQQAAGKQALADVDRHLRTLKITYAELPVVYQRKVAFAPPDDWARIDYPSRDEVSRLRSEAAGLDAAKRNQRSAQDTLDRWRQAHARIESATATLAKVKAGLPAGDAATVRAEHRTLEADEKTLTNDVKGTKTSLQAVDTDIDRFGREAHSHTTRQTQLVGLIQNEETVRRECRERVEHEMKKLPADWHPRVQDAGMGDYLAWKGDLDALAAADAGGRFRKLEQSRAGLDAIRSDVQTLAADADAFPPECRRPADAVRADLTAARGAAAASDQELNAARRRKSVFDGHREQRAKLGDQFKTADAEHNRYKILSELLGRDRLQRHLVRQAERQIVDYANGVLDRLSGGQLFLKLVGSDDGGGADRALDLECANRVTGGSPINVQFLSGSQKFRVAVSLALGIGQYASKQHRPIESVIIDEGFGCLDRQGRQVMIQELQNLRGHLHCILLVSHQEEFADAFPDGYRFELADGATRVTRFQR